MRYTEGFVNDLVGDYINRDNRIKELEAKVQELEKENAELEKENEKLKQELNDLSECIDLDNKIKWF